MSMLAVDVGSVTGYVVLDGDALIARGTIKPPA